MIGCLETVVINDWSLGTMVNSARSEVQHRQALHADGESSEPALSSCLSAAVMLTEEPYRPQDSFVSRVFF